MRNSLLEVQVFRFHVYLNGGRPCRMFVFIVLDPSDLERVLRESITEGQNKTHRSWRKILIIVEGIYSMEGEICKLAEIVKIKKKYKVRHFLFV